MEEEEDYLKELALIDKYLDKIKRGEPLSDDDDSDLEECTGYIIVYKNLTVKMGATLQDGAEGVAAFYCQDKCSEHAIYINTYIIPTSTGMVDLLTKIVNYLYASQ